MSSITNNIMPASATYTASLTSGPLTSSIISYLFLESMKSSPYYNFAVWLLWFIIGLTMILLTLAIDSPQIIFTLYGSGAFILLMSFTTLF